MKLETYLNALEYAVVDYMSDHFMGSYAIRSRQGKAFRARILRMDAEKGIAYDTQLRMSRELVDYLEQKIVEKDAEIEKYKEYR